MAIFSKDIFLMVIFSCEHYMYCHKNEMKELGDRLECQQFSHALHQFLESVSEHIECFRDGWRKKFRIVVGKLHFDLYEALRGL